jgi:AraC family transcriptional regulator
MRLQSEIEPNTAARASRGASSLDTARAFTPDEWAAQLSAPPELSSCLIDWRSALLRQWRGTSAEMDQPPLDHHYVVQHLGGAKRVHRKGEGSAVSAVVESGALSFVSAGTNFRWRTEGPIQFAHLYVSPELLKETAVCLERPAEVQLIDQVGCRDPLLETLFAAMLAQAREPGPLCANYMDSLLETFLMRLIVAHTNACVRPASGSETLASFQLNRVIDLIEAHLARHLALSELAHAAGTSVFHFSRAFRNAVGETPHQFVLRRRVARARALLRETNLPVPLVASKCGFNNPVHFARAFARLVGTTPLRFRQR